MCSQKDVVHLTVDKEKESETEKNNKDFPQIRAIQRAMTNVDEEKRNRMLEVLKISFQEAFEEDDDD